MVARLVKNERNGCWYCSECKMRQFKVEERCEFCWNVFSNYEEVLMEDMKMVEDEKIMDVLI